MKPVVFHAEAEAELDRDIAYYEGRRKGLGDDLRAKVEAAVRQIRRNPKAFSQHKDTELRKCLLKRFPYTIFYLELDNVIWVAAIAHQKRRPDYWVSRSPEE